LRITHDAALIKKDHIILTRGILTPARQGLIITRRHSQTLTTPAKPKTSNNAKFMLDVAIRWECMHSTACGSLVPVYRTGWTHSSNRHPVAHCTEQLEFGHTYKISTSTSWKKQFHIIKPPADRGCFFQQLLLNQKARYGLHLPSLALATAQFCGNKVAHIHKTIVRPSVNQ
jgi:hypothetical protein